MKVERSGKSHPVKEGIIGTKIFCLCSRLPRMRPDLKRLREYGIRTVADFLSCDTSSISQRMLLPSQDLTTMQKRLTADLSAFPLNGADIFEEMMSGFSILSTGCERMDHLLDGGLYSGEVTEIVGTAGVGKSQICLSVAAFVAMVNKQNVLYIDTGGSFSASRLKEMLLNRDNSLNDEAVSKILSRIAFIHAFDVHTVLGALERIKEGCDSQDDLFYRNIQLVIVDSVASVITPILGGQQVHGHSLMVHLSRYLKSLAVEYTLPVLITNNVVSDAKGQFAVKPALGQTWSHVPNTRVFINKDTASCATSDGASATERVATVIKSNRQPLQVSVIVYIGSGGMSSDKPSSGRDIMFPSGRK